MRRWRLLLRPRALVLLRCFTGRLLGPSRFGFLCAMQPRLNSGQLRLSAGYVPGAGSATSLALGGLATTKRHVMFESWCERDHLIAFDFDPEVIGAASQPFRLEFTTSEGPRCPHVPDYLLRNADGVGIVVDIRPEALIDAQDRLCFAGTAALVSPNGLGVSACG
jgi:hypothetical protein